MKAVIYSKPWCPFCIKAKKMLNEAGIEYEEIDVEKDEDNYEEMISKSGQRTVPVIEMDGRIIVGSDQLSDVLEFYR